MAEFGVGSKSNPLDTERILRVFGDFGVDFVLIGGTACIVHGAEQTTYDADVLPSIDAQNVERLFDALHALDAKVFLDEKRAAFEAGEPWEVASLRRGMNGLRDADAWHFTTDAGFVDIVMTAVGVGDYEAHLANALELQIFGVAVRVAGLDDLIRSKESLRREKDLAVIDQLRHLRAT